MDGFKRASRGPKRAKMTPKTSKMTPKTSKMIPKTTQMTPKMGQDGLQEVVLDSLGPLKRKKTVVCVGFCIGRISEL